MIFLRIIVLWLCCYLFSYIFVSVSASTFFGFGPSTLSKKEIKIYSCIWATALSLFAIWATDGDILKPLSTNL